MQGSEASVRVIDHQRVHHNPYPNHRPESYSGTTICRVPDRAGRPVLLCGFRLGSARMSPDGGVPLYRSDDDGTSWTRIPSPLEATPNMPASELPPAHPRAGRAALAGPHLGASAAGTLLLTAARMWITEPGAPDWDDAAAGLTDADSVIVRGTLEDGWEAPRIIDARRHPDEWAIPCGPPLHVGGQRWVFPLERHGRAYMPRWLERYHALAALSSDDGRTWPEMPPMLNDPTGRIAHYDQRVSLLADGRIASLVWAHDVVTDVTLPARVGWSADGGHTWTGDLDTSIIGGPVNTVALRDGRLLAAYARRTAPRGIRACVSADGGATWSTDQELVIFDEASGEVVGELATVHDRREADAGLWGSMWGWTFGQPMPIALDDGMAGLVFFGVGPDRAPAVHFVRLAIDG